MEQKEFDGQGCAKLFKYYMQERKPYLKFKISFGKIQAKGCYDEHRAAFDKTAAFFMKNGLDLSRYMRFFVIDRLKSEQDIDSDLCSFAEIRKYADEIQVKERRRKIYGWVEKSAKNVAEICVRNGIQTAKAGMLYFIRNGMIASLYMSGVVSNYFLASIPGFDKIIMRLDDISKNEFRDLLERFDMYKKDADESFKFMKNMSPNPIRMADEFIKKMVSKHV